MRPGWRAGYRLHRAGSMRHAGPLACSCCAPCEHKRAGSYGPRRQRKGNVTTSIARSRREDMADKILRPRGAGRGRPTADRRVHRQQPGSEGAGRLSRGLSFGKSLPRSISFLEPGSVREPNGRWRRGADRHKAGPYRSFRFHKSTNVKPRTRPSPAQEVRGGAGDGRRVDPTMAIHVLPGA